MLCDTSFQKFIFFILVFRMAKSYSPHTVYGATKGKIYIFLSFSNKLLIQNFFPKVMSHFFVRALNDRLDRKPLVVCSADPGMCATTILHRHNEGLASFVLAFLYRTVGRTAEEGSRPIVWGAVGGEEKKDEMRGGYVSTVAKVDMPSDFIMSEKGHIAQEKLWVRFLLLLFVFISLTSFFEKISITSLKS